LSQKLRTDFSFTGLFFYIESVGGFSKKFGSLYNFCARQSTYLKLKSVAPSTMTQKYTEVLVVAQASWLSSTDTEWKEKQKHKEAFKRADREKS
jgi:hypothetical protein